MTIVPVIPWHDCGGEIVKSEVQLSSRLTRHFNVKNWKFTGRIKYETYSFDSFLYFEVTYRRRISDTQPGYETITKFLSEGYFRIVEIPEVTIMECRK